MGVWSQRVKRGKQIPGFSMKLVEKSLLIPELTKEGLPLEIKIVSWFPLLVSSSLIIIFTELFPLPLQII
jgi:hypothetical protein